MKVKELIDTLRKFPDDAPVRADGEMFDRDYMGQLEEIGRRMGRDPTSWQTTCPEIRWLRQW